MKYVKQSIIATVIGLSLSHATQAQDAVMYTTYPIAEIEIVQNAVKQQHGINLSNVYGSTAVTMRRIEAESSQPAADIFWSSSANTMTPFKEYFEPYRPADLAHVAESFHYEGDYFQPMIVGILGLMVNENFLDGNPMPTSWADLAKPEWKGKIVTANPENSSTGYSVVYGLSRMLDEETYKAVIANMVVTESYRSLAPSVASGEYVIAPVYEAAPLEYIDGGQEEIKIVYPNEGVFINIEYAGIIKDGPNGEAGQKIIDTLLSKDVQTKLLTDRFRRPVRSDIRVADYLDLPELSDIVVFETDELAASAVRDEILSDWRALPKGN